LLVWIEFGVCVLLIGVAGVKLSRYGDIIGEKSGLGGTWIGLVMLASVTSLPELVTGVTSVTIAGVPDIAVGDVLGSCVFNLLIIVILDFLYREESIYSRASRGHILAGAFGVMLIGFTGFNIVLSGDGAPPALAHVGLYSPVIIILYIISMRTLYRYERLQLAEFTGEIAERYAEISLRQALIRYTLAAVVVVGAGAALPFVAKALAAQMGWSESFVGTLFVAFATSLPEIVVTIAALRLGALDMAVSNLFGSNLFNIFILVIDDVAYLPGPLLADISPAHAMSAMSAVMMTGAAMGGLLYRPRTRVFRTVGWASIALFVVYVLNTYVLYLYDGF